MKLRKPDKTIVALWLMMGVLFAWCLMMELSLRGRI